MGRIILLSHKYGERVIDVTRTAAGATITTTTTTNFNSKLASEDRLCRNVQLRSWMPL
ncbi:MAG TPA: hypothetical protein VKA40_02995 [Nitrososphaera sp.]|nr:hypothetical protein [Nitrososphaera sp.]